MTAIYLATMLVFWAGSASAYVYWPNESGELNLLVDQPFDFLTVPGITNEYGGGAIAPDITAPFSPPNVLEECAGPGPGFGTAADLWTTLDSTQAYVGFWFKRNYVASTGSGMYKIIFLKSNLVPAYLFGYGDAWNLQWDLQPDPSVNNCHIPGAWGDSNCHIFPSAINLDSNTWYQIEYFVQTSTSESSRNGIIQMWVTPAGGATTQVMNLTDVNWPGPLYQTEITPTWDGGTPHDTRDCQWFDHYRVRQGGGSPAPPTDAAPPAAPKGVRIT